jgi:hypothetical protein
MQLLLLSSSRLRDLTRPTSKNLDRSEKLTVQKEEEDIDTYKQEPPLARPPHHPHHPPSDICDYRNLGSEQVIHEHC